MLEPGTTVERYVVVGKLGEGGMARVYAVRHSVLGSSFALKVLYGADPAVRTRLIREGRVQAQLEHPNVVPVQDVLDIDGAPGLLMPLVQGPSLDELLAGGPLDRVAAATLFHGIVRGVAHAHRNGVVHRDLKPGNVLLDIRHEEVVPRVADFGLATEAGGTRHTQSGMLMGTPAYAAPEQLEDAASVDARADVWSLGCILYELLAGRRPFAGGSLVELIGQVVRGKFPELPAEVESGWRDLVNRMLVVDPAARMTADEVLAAVEGLTPDRTLSGDVLERVRSFEGAPVEIPSTADAYAPTWRHSTVPPPVPPTLPPETDSRAPQSSRMAYGLVGAAVISLGLVAAGAWWTLSASTPATEWYGDVQWTATGFGGVGTASNTSIAGYRLDHQDDGRVAVSRVDADGAVQPFEREPWARIARPTVAERALTEQACDWEVDDQLFCDSDLKRLSEDPVVVR